MKLFLLLIVLPFCAGAADLYQPKKLSERQLVQTYTDLLLDSCHHADKFWTVAKFDPAAGYWGGGETEGNGGIRSIVSQGLACAALLKYDRALSESDRANLRDKLTAALRYTVATHITGTQNCTDGKKWGGVGKPREQRWQTAMWTGTLAMDAWLVWDQLDAGLRQDLERVIAAESDMLLKDTPPNGLWLDTKAEENGWNVPCLALSELMFPDHPHAAAWREKGEEYMMNTLCTAADLQDTNLVDGRPMNQWVHGANIQPDFTLENHNIFHPAYVGCSSYFLTQAAMYYTYGHRPVPQAAMHHLLDTWHMFEGVMLPWGESACPQSMDWELHNLPFINLYASLACREQDAFAARMESASLQHMRAWQLMCHGDLTVPGSRLGIVRHTICAEQAAYGLLAHEIFGPAAKPLSDRAARAITDGVKDYPYVDFIVQRTKNKLVSFSWKNNFMGLIIPLGEGHDGEPFFTAPLRDSLTGTFELAPRGDAKAKVVEHSWRQLPDGFETAGTLLLNGGRLKQIIKLTSIGENIVVYQDVVTAVSNITVTLERAVPMPIENDPISGGERIVSHGGGTNVFNWGKPEPSLSLPGSWANVDGRLGVISPAGTSMTYVPGTNYLPGISIGADILYSALDNQRREFKAGEEVARRAEIFCTEISPKETAKLAHSVKIDSEAPSRALRFEEPNGQKAEVPLL